MKDTGFSRVSKNLIINEIEKEIKRRPMLFIAQHTAVPSSSLDKLRARLRGNNARYMVVKNSLGKRALDRASLKDLAGSLNGTCGIAFSAGDPVASSKVLVDFAKENQGFKIQNGFLNGEMISFEQIRALANLPSREVLIARVVGGVQAPISRFVGVLSGTLRKLVTALDQIAKKKGTGSGS